MMFQVFPLHVSAILAVALPMQRYSRWFFRLYEPAYHFCARLTPPPSVHDNGYTCQSSTCRSVQSRHTSIRGRDTTSVTFCANSPSNLHTRIMSQRHDRQGPECQRRLCVSPYSRAERCIRVCRGRRCAIFNVAKTAFQPEGEED